MTKQAREYKRATIRRLDILSGNQCAAPDCQKPLIARDGETIISQICHIEAASEYGPRYNPDMNDDERRHFNNLILLCDECHKMIDNMENVRKYPVSLLKEWKTNHESKQISKLNSNPSLLMLAINAIAKLDFYEIDSKNDRLLKKYNPEDKIIYNSVKRNKPLIEEHKIFFAKINTLYNELELHGSFKKTNLLRNIENLYLKIKGQYTQDSPDPMKLVRENADNIIEDIEDKLLERIEIDTKRYHEDISFGISIIMVDAFIRCKILEEPPKNDTR